MENLSLTLILVALIPVLVWLYVFYRKQPEKKTYVALTFLAGMMSVLPIKMYEKYWDTAIFKVEHFNLFQSVSELINTPSLAKLLAYITVDIIVAGFLFLFVAIMMFFLEVLSGDNTIKTFKNKFIIALESPLFFVSIGAMMGIFTYFAASWSALSLVYFVVVVGMLEEFVKHLVVRFSDEFKIHSVNDAIEFSIIVALGFAFVENVLYFHDPLTSAFTGGQFVAFLALRSFISVAAHVIFSAVFGYFYGRAKMAQRIYNQVEYRKHVVIEKLHQALHCKASTLFHEEQMMVGMLSAMILHAIFNGLLQFGKVSLVIPLIVIFLGIVIGLFKNNITENEKPLVPQTS